MILPYEIFFQAGPEGSGPTPHSHSWDEAFFVMRGEVRFGIGDRESLAVEGTLVQVPGGTTHWFRYGRGGGDMLSMTSGGGASAFFTDVDRIMLNLMPRSLVRKMVAKMFEQVVAKKSAVR